MKTSQAGFDLITSFEGVRLTAYVDPKTGGEPISIGFGHTGGVKLGDTITLEEAYDLLHGDLMHAEDVIEKLVKVPLTDNEHGALASFIFNCGEGNFAKSTLLKKLNAMKYAEAADEFLRWVSPGSAVEKGLTRRRIAERNLFLNGV